MTFSVKVLVLDRTFLKFKIERLFKRKKSNQKTPLQTHAKQPTGTWAGLEEGGLEVYTNSISLSLTLIYQGDSLLIRLLINVR